MVSRLVRIATSAVVTLLGLLPAPAAAQQTGADLSPITTVEGITEYELDNGLRVLLFPDPSRPQITVNITYMVGARQGWLEGRRLGRSQDGNLAGGLSQNLYFDRTFQFDADLEERVRSATLEEVNQAIRDRLDLSKLTIVKAGDFANKRTTIG